MQFGGRLSFPRRLRQSGGALSGFAQDLGTSEGQAPEGLRNRCIELCGPFALAWPGAQSSSIGGSRTEETLGLTSGFVSFHRVRFDLAGGWHARIVRTTGFARVAELADAYGSGPYGETRGGSSPLASSPLISPPTLFESEGYRQPSLPIILVDYLRAVFLRAARVDIGFQRGDRSRVIGKEVSRARIVPVKDDHTIIGEVEATQLRGRKLSISVPVRGDGILDNRKAPGIVRVEQGEFVWRRLAIAKGVIHRVASQSRFPAIRQKTGCHARANPQSAGTWSARR